ncbi:hypothetical protein P389DRAFT_192318 [Cystobasidium minutum MCA 4210]|uniref:uncharacterized protein n=1 Tax=Cystobasidium minutum MCA 4210 TaxID=1397322 RepID=UPI0034CD3374|eukprot:jgi/Rhomi1/192318/gm1.532_g
MDHHTGYLHDSYKPPLQNHTAGRMYYDDSDASTSSSLSLSDSDSDSDTSTSSYDSELLELQAAEQEWEENVRQLQLAVSVLILPTLGKWLGRRWSYFLYARYIQVGWSWSVFLPENWSKKPAT